MSDTVKPIRVRCSFCGKDAKEVKKMIAGPDRVHICDECVLLCREIVEEGVPKAAEPTESLANMRPPAIRAYLDEHVVGQDRAKLALSVAVYNHFKRIRDTDDDDDDTELSKGNILMIGPTGSGKTLVAKTLAKKLGVPFTMADATTLTEAGYVGEDVESIVKNLWLAADRDPELAAKGIVCIDEVDKIGRSGGGAGGMRDVGGEGVQQALLKVIESQNVMIPPEGSRTRPQQEFIQVDTTDILFVCCGSFEGIHDIIERRVSRSSIGFGAEVDKVKAKRSELLRQVTPQDLTKFGLIPEFVGRLPVIVTLDELDESELVEILWKPRNALVRQYVRLFEFEGVKLKFHHEAMIAVVAEAITRGSGARGLRAILEGIMLDIMYEMPSLTDVIECVITEECVLEGAPPVLIREKKSA
ncbi:MAG: ATP-dependent Clp protease ATP-binding subunit ClpX [Bradymonadia bacterium]|jgi:ATP-dependent Clp protease ATP-binding subunit ClpX